MLYKGLKVILRLNPPGAVFDAVGLFATGRHGPRTQAIRGSDARLACRGFQGSSWSVSRFCTLEHDSIHLR